MAAITRSVSGFTWQSSLSGLAARFDHIAARWAARWQARRRRSREISRLSAVDGRELRDLGLSRAVCTAIASSMFMIGLVPVVRVPRVLPGTGRTYPRSPDGGRQMPRGSEPM
jgi:uncharacterized protein YjiS (DUF1127 family)